MCLLLVTAAGAAEPPTEQSEAVIATVNAFHKELERSDEKAVLELLAPDAVILENGYAETRAEYERHHLKEDITFTRAVRSTRSRRIPDCACMIEKDASLQMAPMSPK